MKQSTSFIEGPGDPQEPAVQTHLRSEIELPELVGSEPQAAVDQLRALGLVAAVEASEVTDEDFVGVICAQEPAAGSVLEPGATVAVFVGQRPPPEQPIEPPNGADEPLDEDDWFDIELPSLHGAAAAQAANAAGSPAEAEQAPAGKPGGQSSGRLRLSAPPRSAALLAACLIAVMAVVALRSCAEPQTPRRADHERPRQLRAPAGDLRRSATPPVLRTVPDRHVAHRARPSRSPAIAPVVSAPAGPATSTAVPSVSDACEFCFERPSP